MKPEQVRYLTLLDRDYTEELRAVFSEEDFEAFLKQWECWLDEETKKLTGEDWKTLKPLLDDCSKESVIPEPKHEPAMALSMPEKIFKVSIVAIKFQVPWGCAYIRMKQEKLIDY